MTASTSQILWPLELDWIFDELKEGEFAPRIETKMDSGHVKSRPLITPKPALEGEVLLKAHSYEALQSARAGGNVFKRPNGSLVSFCFPPRVIQHKYTVGDEKNSTYLVQIMVIDHNRVPSA